MTPGPYHVPPPQQQMPMLPQPVYAPPTQTDSKAVIALILGIVSILCCVFGMLFGIPAIVLGAMSKRDINRSGGMLGGDGMAIGGMVMGGLATLISIGYIVVEIVTFAALGTASTAFPPTPYVPTSTYTTPLATGAIHTTELRHGGPLKDQLIAEVTSAKVAGEKVLLYEYAKGAIACAEFDRTLPDSEMQTALGSVRLVRVDVGEFAPSELAALGMAKPAYPWLYKLDTKPIAGGSKDDLAIVDSISGDEWTDNYSFNIAPVLEQFMSGTYVKHATAFPVPSAYKAPPAPSATHGLGIGL